MRKLLVTGGCGFIGTNFVRREVTSKTSKILNVDAITYCANPANLEDLAADQYKLKKADICDREVLREVLREFRPDAVVHFAAESHVDRSIASAEPFFRTNVLGTLALLEESLGYWKNLDPTAKESFRFLHVSTDEVYGSLDLDSPAFTETTPYAPNSPYAASKAASDHVVRAFHVTHGLPTLVTNCSNNYGPYQFPEKLIPFFIKRALSGENLPVYGDGKNRRDWLFVEDHCSAVSTVLEKGRPGSNYNIGGGKELSNLEITGLICKLLDEMKPAKDGRSYQSLVSFVKDRPGHDFRYAINHEKISSELNWHPSHIFEDALRKTVAWYLDNPRFMGMVE